MLYHPRTAAAENPRQVLRIFSAIAVAAFSTDGQLQRAVKHLVVIVVLIVVAFVSFSSSLATELRDAVNASSSSASVALGTLSGLDRTFRVVGSASGTALATAAFAPSC